MTKETDHLSVDIACIDGAHMLASLVATTGSHCEVWRSAGYLERQGRKTGMDFVIKRYRGSCTMAEIRSLAGQYRQLQTRLEDIVPRALFIATRVGGTRSVCVLAEHVGVWFNIANPTNADDAIPLLRTLPKARNQLTRFVRAAREWRASDNPRVIDLFGMDNLVLDVNREVRYLDSFHVFFFEDLLHLLDERDEQLAAKIQSSLERINYLEYVLAQSGH